MPYEFKYDSTLKYNPNKWGSFLSKRKADVFKDCPEDSRFIYSKDKKVENIV